MSEHDTDIKDNEADIDLSPGYIDNIGRLVVRISEKWDDSYELPSEEKG